MTDEAPRIIVLGNVAYRVTNFNRRTVRQDHFLQRNLRRIGADKLLPEADEDSTAFVMRVQSCIVDSGLAHEFIAGLIVPQDIEQWTVELAKFTADKIGALDSPEDREEVANLCTELAFSYFADSIEKLARAQVLFGSAEHTLSSKPTH